MSNARKIRFLTLQKIHELKQVKLKERTGAKLNWAVNAFSEWHNVRLSHCYNEVIFNANLESLNDIDRDSFCEALCYFIPEVTKVKGDGMYPAKTLYQMIVAIQKYLNVNKIPWKLIDGPQFESVKNVLDNVMKERTQLNVGTVKKQVELITYDQENMLWKEGVLGENSPDKLRDTVLFLLGVNLALRAGDEHYQLHRDIPGKPSQLSFERDSRGIRCMVYCEDTGTKTNDGGLKQMRKERKVVWVYPNHENVTRCLVHLVDKYISLCPPFYKKPNFYLQSLTKTNPAQWFAEQVVGINVIKKVVKNILGRANIEGYFTNHSLRHTGGSRLFQAGVDHKIVKEEMGHASDAIDGYQITSDIQKEECSKVLGEHSINKVKKVQEEALECENDVVVEEENIVPVISTVTLNGKEGCSCTETYTPKNNNWGDMINGIIESNRKGRKTVVKIQIEIEDE